MNRLESQRQESLQRRWQERRAVPNMNSTRLINGAVPPSSAAFLQNPNRIQTFPRLDDVPNMNSTWLINGAVPPSSAAFLENPNRIQTFPRLDDDDLVSAVVPPVTVVLEGRSICQRISLQKHASYQSLAKALRQMFVDGDDAGVANSEHDIDLSNAVPGHLIAYEDMENDLLLAGDLNWKDFVRVAKRIRILPVKGNSRKGPSRRE